jgi:solute:Na+ symporter, SSS family
VIVPCLIADCTLFNSFLIEAMSSTLFLSCFILYIVFLAVFGWWVTRKRQSGDDFLLGGRSLPFFLTLGTTVATMVGTGSSMGAVGKAYESGWMGGLYGLGGGIGILLVAWWFAPMRKHQFMTMSEELGSYVGANRLVMNIVAVFVYLSNVAWLGAHILGGAKYLSFVTELDPVWAKVLIAAGFGIYSVIGGYRAVVWTDTIQAVVLFFGFFLTGVLAFNAVGGFAGLQTVHAAQVAKGSHMDLLPAISLVAVIAVGVIGGSTYRQRIYSGDSIRQIRKAFVTSGVLYLGFTLLPAVIGMAAYQANNSLTEYDHAFPWVATEMLPVAVGIIILLAGLSATMSSASSDVLTGVTVVVRELYLLAFGRMPRPDRVVLISRVAVAFTSVLALGLALGSNGILDYIKNMIALFLTGLAVCGVMGRFWDRFNAVGAITVLVTAFGTSLAFKFLPAWDSYWGGAVLPSIAVSSIAGILASLLTPPDARTQAESIEFLTKERDEMTWLKPPPPPEPQTSDHVS